MGVENAVPYNTLLKEKALLEGPSIKVWTETYQMSGTLCQRKH